MLKPTQASSAEINKKNVLPLAESSQEKIDPVANKLFREDDFAPLHRNLEELENAPHSSSPWSIYARAKKIEDHRTRCRNLIREGKQDELRELIKSVGGGFPL